MHAAPPARHPHLLPGLRVGWEGAGKGTQRGDAAPGCSVQHWGPLSVLKDKWDASWAAACFELGGRAAQAPEAFPSLRLTVSVEVVVVQPHAQQRLSS